RPPSAPLLPYTTLFRSNGGGLTISSGGTMSSALTLASGTALILNGGTFSFATGTTLSGSGAWTISGAAVGFDIAFSPAGAVTVRSDEHTSELQSHTDPV